MSFDMSFWVGVLANYYNKETSSVYIEQIGLEKIKKEILRRLLDDFDVKDLERIG